LRQHLWLADSSGRILEQVGDKPAAGLRSRAEQALATWIDLYG